MLSWSLDKDLMYFDILRFWRQLEWMNLFFRPMFMNWFSGSGLQIVWHNWECSGPVLISLSSEVSDEKLSGDQKDHYLLPFHPWIHQNIFSVQLLACNNQEKILFSIVVLLLLVGLKLFWYSFLTYFLTITFYEWTQWCI